MKVLSLFIYILLFSLFSCNHSAHKKTKNQEENDSTLTQYINQGVEYLNEGEYFKSQIYFDSAKTFSETNSIDTNQIIDLLISEAELYKKTGDYDKGLSNYFEALKFSKLTNDSLHTGLSYYNLASIYFYTGKIDESEKYNLKAQKIYSLMNLSNKLMDSYTQYAVICKSKKEYKKAKSYLKNVINYYQKNNDKQNLSIALNNLGNIYFKENKISEAIKEYKEALKLSKAVGDKYSTAIKYGNIGESYLEIGDFIISKK